MSNPPVSKSTIMRSDLAKVGKTRAIEIGQTYYWTGVPCNNGHVDFRYISTYICATCARRRSIMYAVKREYGEVLDGRQKAEAITDQLKLEKELKEVWDE